MIDVKKITPEMLAQHLHEYEPTLVAQVDQQKLGVLCKAACTSLQQQDKGRGR
ncbi:MAG: hypothetical protein ACK502_09215 [Alphaproteobacteria bacterium]